MFISIDEKAATWFSKEFDLQKPFSVRMFPQYAGFGTKHKGYSLAFSAETPGNTGYKNELNGITFFVDVNDIWFFNDTETSLTVDNNLEEIMVTYKEVLVSA